MKEGAFEVEGSEEFVKTMMEEYKDLFSSLQIGILAKKPSRIAEPTVEKKDRRGGVRSAVISPAIDKLIDDGWLDNLKKEKEITDELKRLGIPGVNIRNVGTALRRRVPDKLDRIKNADNKWTYKKR